MAGVTIDAWKTCRDDEEGSVIAQVILTKHGDIVTVWQDNGARLDKGILSAIEESKAELKDVWAEYTAKNQTKYVYLKDDQGDMDLLAVHNWDDKFKAVLNSAYTAWRDTQSENHNEIYDVLRDAGYVFDVTPCDVIIPGEY